LLERSAELAQRSVGMPAAAAAVLPARADAAVEQRQVELRRAASADRSLPLPARLHSAAHRRSGLHPGAKADADAGAADRQANFVARAEADPADVGAEAFADPDSAAHAAAGTGTEADALADPDAAANAAAAAEGDAVAEADAQPDADGYGAEGHPKAAVYADAAGRSAAEVHAGGAADLPRGAAQAQARAQWPGALRRPRPAALSVKA